MPGWKEVAKTDQLAENSVVSIRVEGQRIGLYQVDGEYFACEDRCPHGSAMLSRGYLEGHEIECPLHQGRLDIRTGEPTEPPIDCPVRTFPVKVEAQSIFVELP